ncbi:hypothetical protein CROQUDRAFT_104999 [Cronartium quercuum f. sp. fusiforme G11]|uniref:Uncharacterized protein n=1 Tax=Cronartium quercuum f. sp. fusiforme G11 TaxID=708437 RepID=A0A9P6NLU2_9BASI|nr:hypothetical protein CROQUDRAFT_104999 [Cronartium quercuum f. sp. fusiforme G11]
MKSLNIFTIAALSTLISPSSASYQQHVLRFDDDDSLPSSPSIAEDPKAAVSVPKPTGFTAKLIQRVTGWNDTVVAKLTGQISPRAPHPFVVSITDENYDDVIKSELDEIQPGWGSADDTIWITVVSATDRVSSVFDDTFDELALNSSQAIHPPPKKLREDQVTVRQLAPDDPFLFPSKLRFGRFDYMGKTDEAVRCPVMVIISKRGQELRFFKVGGLPPTLEHLAQFIREEGWAYKPVWNSSYSPGGSKEWIVELLGKAFKLFHDVTDQIPGWLMMMVSSVLGTSLMQCLHRPSASKSRKRPPAKETGTTEVKAELAKAAIELAHTTSRRTQGNAETEKVAPDQEPRAASASPGSQEEPKPTKPRQSESGSAVSPTLQRPKEVLPTHYRNIVLRLRRSTQPCPSGVAGLTHFGLVKEAEAPPLSDPAVAGRPSCTAHHRRPGDGMAFRYVIEHVPSTDRPHLDIFPKWLSQPGATI